MAAIEPLSVSKGDAAEEEAATSGEGKNAMRGLDRKSTMKVLLANGNEPMQRNQALFNLISSVVGAGIMALPKTISRVGFIPGVFLLCMVTTVSIFSCHLVHRAMLMNPTARCAEDLAESAFGPGMRKVVLLFNNGDLFATCVILLVGGGDALSIVLTDLGQKNCIVIVGIIVAALSLPKDLSALSKAALAGVVTLAMYVAVYLLDGVLALVGDTRSSDQTVANFDLSKIAGAASIVGFSYSCAILMPSMHVEMAVKEDLVWVINTGHGVVFAIYGSMAMLAYAAYGNEGLEVSPEIASMTKLEWAPTFCACCILVTIMVGYPLFLNPMAAFIEAMLKAAPERELPNRLIVRIGLAGLSLVAALVVPYFYEVVLLTGAISANLMCVILPMAYYVKSVSNGSAKGTDDDSPATFIKVMICVALVQGFAVMIVGVYYGVLDLQAAMAE